MHSSGRSGQCLTGSSDSPARTSRETSRSELSQPQRRLLAAGSIHSVGSYALTYQFPPPLRVESYRVQCVCVSTAEKKSPYISNSPLTRLMRRVTIQPSRRKRHDRRKETKVALKATRKEQGLTQTQVASASRIHVRDYQRYEAGGQCPSVKTALRIANGHRINSPCWRQGARR